jgi:hypothetical protein
MQNRDVNVNLTRNWKVIAVVLVGGALVGACKRDTSAVASAETVAAPGAAPACLETNVRQGAGGSCMACLASHAISPGKDGCCGIEDDVGRHLCEAVASCMRSGRIPTTGGPCNAGGDTSTCFCGAHQVNCWLAGVADGPCIKEITAAAGRNIETRTTDAPNEDTILNRYGDVKYALGRASNIAAIAGAFCGAECELR